MTDMKLRSNSCRCFVIKHSITPAAVQHGMDSNWSDNPVSSYIILKEIRGRGVSITKKETNIQMYFVGLLDWLQICQ